MEKIKSRDIPKSMHLYYQAIISLTYYFCQKNLNEGYTELTQKAAAILCQDDQNPEAFSDFQLWACSIIYAIGSINFLFDKSKKPYFCQTAFCKKFNLKLLTVKNKANEIIKLLNMTSTNPEWILKTKNNIKEKA